MDLLKYLQTWLGESEGKAGASGQCGNHASAAANGQVILRSRSNEAFITFPQIGVTLRRSTRLGFI